MNRNEIPRISGESSKRKIRIVDINPAREFFGENVIFNAKKHMTNAVYFLARSLKGASSKLS
ncbi:hypothetical protein C4559_01510 [Candidatus Microgenomates bacterium]|nr:MAG: hypothetical protein C4559_01510 [Candidatus Microgenomates bacterium]